MISVLNFIGAEMWPVARMFTKYAAICAIALHGLSPGLPSLYAASNSAPLWSICHSLAAGVAQDRSSDRSDPAAHDCDYCTLCCGAPPLGLAGAAVAIRLAPTRLLHVLTPIESPTRAGYAVATERARGPPAFA